MAKGTELPGEHMDDGVVVPMVHRQLDQQWIEDVALGRTAVIVSDVWSLYWYCDIVVVVTYCFFVAHESSKHVSYQTFRSSEGSP